MNRGNALKREGSKHNEEFLVGVYAGSRRFPNMSGRLLIITIPACLQIVKGCFLQIFMHVPIEEQ